MTISKSKLVADYVEAKAQFEKWKRLENTLRVKVVEAFFPSGGEGTHKTEFKGVEVKAGIKFNYKFDQDELAELEDDFNPAEEACVKRRPSLDLTRYRKLTEEDRVTIDDCIIITPGLPSLDIKEIEQ